MILHLFYFFILFNYIDVIEYIATTSWFKKKSLNTSIFVITAEVLEILNIVLDCVDLVVRKVENHLIIICICII